MKVSTILSPTDQPITDEQLAEWLRIDASQDVATLRILIFAAVAMIEAVINKTVLQTTFRADTGCNKLEYDLPRTPVYDVNSVSVDGQPLARGVDWKVCGETVRLTVLPASAPVITWTAGFSPLPSELQYAIMMLVGSGYDNRQSIPSATLETVKHLCAPHRRITL